MWTYSEIESEDPVRALALQAAPSPACLQLAVLSKVEDAWRHNALRVGMEQAGAQSNDERVVIQFHVGETLFDQFLNATTGYRAQFRKDWLQGNLYNLTFMHSLRSQLCALLPAQINARLLTSEFDDAGPLVLSPIHILESLESSLSKIWFCSRLMTGDGQIRQLPIGAVGPRLLMDDSTTWAAPSRTDGDAWLEVKGAFLGAVGTYQIKDPISRAIKLQQSGEA